MAVQLAASLAHWGRDDFNATLVGELQGLDLALLPLQQGLAHSSHVSPEPIRALLLNTAATEQQIEARVGIFYAGLTAGCSCADDPTPLESQPEYCEVRLVLDRATAEAQFWLIEDN